VDFLLLQGEPGPRGEQGREGSSGPNGDPVSDENHHDFFIADFEYV